MEYTGPAEATRQRCSRGCEMYLEQESWECKAKACAEDNLCEGCAYTCAVCDETFCQDHVTDVAPEAASEAIYVCRGCLAAKKPGTAPVVKSAAEVAA